MMLESILNVTEYKTDLVVSGALYFTPGVGRWVANTVFPVIATSMVRQMSFASSDHLWSTSSKIIGDNMWVTFFALSLLQPNDTLGMEGLFVKTLFSAASTPVVQFWRDWWNQLLTETTYTSIYLPDEDPIFSRFNCLVAGQTGYPCLLDPNQKTLYSRGGILSWLQFKNTSPVTRENITIASLKHANEVNANIIHRVQFLKEHKAFNDLKNPDEIIKSSRTQIVSRQLSLWECLKKITGLVNKSSADKDNPVVLPPIVEDVAHYLRVFRDDVSKLDGDLKEIPLFISNDVVLRAIVCPITNKCVLHPFTAKGKENQISLVYEESAIKEWIEKTPHLAPPGWPEKQFPLTLDDITAHSMLQLTIQLRLAALKTQILKFIDTFYGNNS